MASDNQPQGPSVYPGKSPYSMLSVEHCVQTVLRLTGQPLEASAVPLSKVRGSVLAEDVAAATPVPPFPASIMDGFAVRSADGKGRFPVDSMEGATAGAPTAGPLAEGRVRYITTGAPVPPGADAVVKVEDTQELREGENLLINVLVESKPGANIRKVGSDMAQGEVVLRRGSRMGAGEIGVLAALGRGRVNVHRKPRVAVLSTGDELVDVADAPDEARGQVLDCNRPMLMELVEEAGAEAIDLGIVRDEPDSLRQRVQRGLDEADVLVTSGGVSRGSKDHMKALLAQLGEIHFGEMCMKPGKPTTFATVTAGGKQRLAFALPGNPVSCFVTFKLLVAPALSQLSGMPEGSALYARVDAELAGPIEMDPVRPEYHRAVARWERGRIVAESTGFQRSSRIASVTSANCLLEIPKRAGVLPKGTVVSALLLPEAGCLRPEPGGYPTSAKPPTTPEVSGGCPATAKPPAPAEAQDHAQKKDGDVCSVGLVAAGTDCATAADALKASLSGRRLSQRAVGSAEEVAAAAAALCEELKGSCRALVVVVCGLGLSEADAAVVEALRSLLEKEAPGVADLVLRTSLRASPLAMLAPPLAGVCQGCLLVLVPPLAVVECVKLLLQLLESGSLLGA